MQKVIFLEQIQEFSDYIDQSVIDYISDGQIETYESFERFDLIAFDWYDLQSVDMPPAQILIYIDRDDLFYICENAFSYEVANSLFIEHPSNEYAMYLFFRNLFKGSTRYIELLEGRISELDDDVSNGAGAGLKDGLTALRNEVLRAKKYYEQLESLFDEMCDNDGTLFSADGLRRLDILRTRSVRFVAQTMNLKEYVTQVREAYQAQINIEQNNLMKVFTLVTSIFLPLTLIAGWYGMNLRMPEFEWKYGYLFVAGLSVAVCLIWFAVFKKKKWFK